VAHADRAGLSDPLVDEHDLGERQEFRAAGVGAQDVATLVADVDGPIGAAALPEGTHLRDARPIRQADGEGDALAGRDGLEPTDLAALHLELGDRLGEVVVEGEGVVAGDGGEGGGAEDGGGQCGRNDLGHVSPRWGSVAVKDALVERRSPAAADDRGRGW